jgi:hypothetical protein
MRGAIPRECTPSPGTYAAITRRRIKPILLHIDSTSAFELEIIEAI